MIVNSYFMPLCSKHNFKSLSLLVVAIVVGAGWFESHFFGNPEDRFSPVEAKILIIYDLLCHYFQLNS